MFAVSYWFRLTICTFLALSIAAVRPCIADEYAGQRDEGIYRKQYEYILYCDMEVMNKFMKYKGAELAPIVRFTISYAKTMHLRRNQPIPPTLKYEELWYSNGRAIGMKRYNDMTLGPLEQGAIYFRSQGDETLAMHDREMANCAMRMIMDIYVKRSIMAGVLVPVDAFDNFERAIQPYQFYILTEASGGKGENMSLHLMSYPRGKDKYYYYDDTGRR